MIATQQNVQSKRFRNGRRAHRKNLHPHSCGTVPSRPAPTYVSWAGRELEKAIIDMGVPVLSFETVRKQQEEDMQLECDARAEKQIQERFPFPTKPSKIALGKIVLLCMFAACIAFIFLIAKGSSSLEYGIGGLSFLILLPSLWTFSHYHHLRKTTEYENQYERILLLRAKKKAELYQLLLSKASWTSTPLPEYPPQCVTSGSTLPPPVPEDLLEIANKLQARTDHKIHCEIEWYEADPYICGHMERVDGSIEVVHFGRKWGD